MSHQDSHGLIKVLQGKKQTYSRQTIGNNSFQSKHKNMPYLHI